MFEKDMRVAELIDIYGSMLSERKREIIEAYYFDDLSLSEIADNTGISRQGVRDSIKKSEIELRSFEDNLRLCKRIKAFYKRVEIISDGIASIVSSLPPEQSEKLTQYLTELRSINL